MFFAKRACSSMVEQWPFKPLVERSSRSTLTEKLCPSRLLFVLVVAPAGGVEFEPLHAHSKWVEGVKNTLKSILFSHPDLLLSRFLRLIPHFGYFPFFKSSQKNEEFQCIRFNYFQACQHQSTRVNAIQQLSTLHATLKMIRFRCFKAGRCHTSLKKSL
jgi:hypothetical protein